MGPDRWALNLDEGIVGDTWRAGTHLTGRALGIAKDTAADARSLGLYGLRGVSKKEHQEKLGIRGKAERDQGYKSGVKAGEATGNVSKVGDVDLAKEASKRTFQKVGKVASDVGTGVGDATSAAAKGIRQGLEDNPAGIAGAAAGALAAGWGLSKLRRKKAPV